MKLLFEQRYQNYKIVLAFKGKSDKSALPMLSDSLEITAADTPCAQEFAVKAKKRENKAKDKGAYPKIATCDLVKGDRRTNEFISFLNQGNVKQETPVVKVARRYNKVQLSHLKNDLEICDSRDTSASV